MSGGVGGWQWGAAMARGDGNADGVHPLARVVARALARPNTVPRQIILRGY